MKRSNALACLLALSIVASAPAQSGTPKPLEAETPPKKKAQEPGGAIVDPSQFGKQMLAKYKPIEGTAKVGTVAEVQLTDGWLFLDGAAGRRFLKDIGNQPGPAILGVAIPPDFAESHAFAVYSYADEGHVGDDEAPDYDQLLADMKESTVEESKDRKQSGLGSVELLGWAEPPHYDKAQHKLYWATRLKFGEEDGLTLNYNVRVLGRAGHLVVNGVGDIDQLTLVAEHSKHLLAVTEFVAGQRYSDFDASTDKLAAYGIGGLIAGGLAVKVGLFAKLGLLLKLAIKPILVGLVVIGGLLAKIFGGRKKARDAKAAGTS